MILQIKILTKIMQEIKIISWYKFQINNLMQTVYQKEININGVDFANDAYFEPCWLLQLQLSLLYPLPLLLTKDERSPGNW